MEWATDSMRIVTTTCSNTEIVCALGAGDQLVGVDDHSDFPPDALTGVKRVGPDLGVDPEKVAALQPDVVLASLTVPGHDKVVASLESAGLPVVALAPRSVRDVEDNIRKIGDLIDRRERAQVVADEFVGMLAELGDSSKTFESTERGPSLLIQWWPKPTIAPGRLSWAHDLIELAGGVNPLGAEDVESRPIDDEEVRQLAPDAMVISWCGVEAHKVRPEVVAKNAEWRELEAVVADRIYCVPEAWLGRPSPRLVHGLRALREIVLELRGVARASEDLRRPVAVSV